MQKEVIKRIFQYVFSDYVSAVLVWFLFLFYRKIKLDLNLADEFLSKLDTRDYIIGFLLVPLFWLVLHLFSGAYFNPFRKSRLHEIIRTLIISICGTLIITSYSVLNDISTKPDYYIRAFFTYFLLQFFMSTFFRMLVLNGVKRLIRKGTFGYNTLIIGGNSQAVKMYHEITQSPIHLGYLFKGFVYADNNANNGLSAYLSRLGSINDLQKIIDEHSIEEVIIAVDTSEHNKLEYILSQLSHRQVIIKITPDSYDIIAGSVRTSNVFGAVLIEIYPELMPDWQKVLKRTLDIVASFLVLIFLSPVYIFTALKVKFSSPGSVFYKQQRIGLYGKPFWIYKFRSMYQNAEDNGPQLSCETDPRITKFGKFIRKWRIDELPQFINILRGDMTLVGPRPERKFFIDLISQTHPHYRYLHQVKPGLTSWGMVKFGYAENINEMIERMRYDLLYIKNCSIALDIKIMLYTFWVILQGRGK